MPWPTPTVTTLVAEVQRRVRDTSASNPSWTTQEILDALGSALRTARGQYWVDGVYDSISLVSPTGQYGLPSSIRRVRRVERKGPGSFEWQLQVITNALSVSWQEVRDWDFVPGEHTGLLTIRNYQPSQYGLRVHYEADLPFDPDVDLMADPITKLSTEYLVLEAIHQMALLRIWSGDTEGNRNISALATEYGRMAQAERARSQQRHLPRTMPIRRQRR